jgi:tmRNA-binding protein
VSLLVQIRASLVSHTMNGVGRVVCFLFFSSFVHKRKVLVVVLQGTKEWRKRTSDKQSSNSKDSEKKLGKYVISNWLRIE